MYGDEIGLGLMVTVLGECKDRLSLIAARASWWQLIVYIWKTRPTTLIQRAPLLLFDKLMREERKAVAESHEAYAHFLCCLCRAIDLEPLQAKRTRRCFENKTHNSLSIQKIEAITLIHIFYPPLSNDQASWEQPLLSNWPFNNGFDGFHLLEETGQKEMVPPGNFVSHSFLPAQTTATLRGRLIRQ